LEHVEVEDYMITYKYYFSTATRICKESFVRYSTFASASFNRTKLWQKHLGWYPVFRFCQSLRLRRS
jgi:hypothetical protein